MLQSAGEARFEAALSRADRTTGGRPPYDVVLMLKVLVLQTLYTLSDDQTEYQLKDRLVVHAVCRAGRCTTRCPDAKTIWLYPRAAGAGRSGRSSLFARFEAQQLAGDLSGGCPARERWR